MNNHHESSDSVNDLSENFNSTEAPPPWVAWEQPTAEASQWYTPVDTEIPTLPPQWQTVLASQQAQEAWQANPIFYPLFEFIKAASPQSIELFHISAALWTLSTLSAGRIAIRFTNRQTRTDLYLANVAPTGIFAKSESLTPAIEILHQTGLNWLMLPGDLTASAAFDEMTPVNLDDVPAEPLEVVTMRNKLAGQRGWLFDEFGEYLSQIVDERGPMGNWRKILLRLKDNRPGLEERTVKHGLRVIKEPFIALLGNATPESFWQIPAKKVSTLFGNGLFARFWFACPGPQDRPDFSNVTQSLPAYPPGLIEAIRQWFDRLPNVTQDNFHRDSLGFSDSVWQVVVSYRSWLFSQIEAGGFAKWQGGYVRQVNQTVGVAGLLASCRGSPTIEMIDWLLAWQVAEKYRHSLHYLIDIVENPQLERNNRKAVEDNILQALAKHRTKGDLPIYVSRFLDREKRLANSMPATAIWQLLNDMHEAGLILLDGRQIDLPPQAP